MLMQFFAIGKKKQCSLLLMMQNQIPPFLTQEIKCMIRVYNEIYIVVSCKKREKASAVYGRCLASLCGGNFVFVSVESGG